VAECTGGNLFIVRDNELYSTLFADILEWITRDSVITITRDLGYEVTKTFVSRDQLYMADEIFVSGTSSEWIGQREIDFRSIGEGKTGPITRTNQKVFQDAKHGKLSHYLGWLDYGTTGIDIPQLVE
jgi:branched-chain amino acid aminotransferase